MTASRFKRRQQLRKPNPTRIGTYLAARPKTRLALARASNRWSIGNSAYRLASISSLIAFVKLDQAGELRITSGIDVRLH